MKNCLTQTGFNRCIFAIHCLLLVAGLVAHADDRETLQRHVSQLQGSPQDGELREKIIKLAQTLKEPPAIPEAVERFVARGKAAAETAKEPTDFDDAAVEFEKASLAAPWLASPYYNIGLMREKSGHFDAAIQNYKLYLLAAPNAPDAKAVKSLIYENEFKQEKQQARMQSLDGKWLDSKKQVTLEISKTEIKFGFLKDNLSSFNTVNDLPLVRGRQVRFQVYNYKTNVRGIYTLTLSSDGSALGGEARWDLCANAGSGESQPRWKYLETTKESFTR